MQADKAIRAHLVFYSSTYREQAVGLLKFLCSGYIYIYVCIVSYIVSPQKEHDFYYQALNLKARALI